MPHGSEYVIGETSFGESQGTKGSLGHVVPLPFCAKGILNGLIKVIGRQGAIVLLCFPKSENEGVFYCECGFWYRYDIFLMVFDDKLMSEKRVEASSVSFSEFEGECVNVLSVRCLIRDRDPIYFEWVVLVEVIH